MIRWIFLQSLMKGIPIFFKSPLFWLISFH
jgi:hypothetical protein